MTNAPPESRATAPDKNPHDRPPLSEAARRALAEAEARRAASKVEDAAKAAEVGGRGGLDPARYGDWEVKGVASDF
jgi:hypothetical protein